MRKGTIARKTLETEIELEITLNGEGKCTFRSGIGFFDHMLSSIARFGMLDIEGFCRGDLEVDGHHTVEDVGICLGQALHQALGDRAGIARLGEAAVPMDEALARAILDISGRAFLRFDAEFTAPMVGAFDTQLVPEFFRAIAVQAGLTLHLSVPYGDNDHHKIEALCKAFGRALDAAGTKDPRITGPLSTKGVLA